LKTLNLGILAHVDAGKTSLTERLLYAAGVIDTVGRVDDGDTQTDSLALERQRGITIKSAVVSFAVGDVTVNLIDTPGHPDFIAEVERVLSVLDGAVLVISAVEGVQAQTRVLMRALRRLAIPTLIFVNKIDRAGASDSFEFKPFSLVPAGRVENIGTRHASVVPVLDRRALDLLSEHDDALIAEYVAGDVSPARLRESLVAQSRRGLVHPVFFGSAITGAGVAALLEELPKLLPAAEGDARGPLSGTVFKVERGPAGEKIAYARLFSGTLRARDRLDAGKVTAVGVFHRGAAVEPASAGAGQIAKLWGLDGIRIGDTLGLDNPRARHHFAPPTLETIVVPDDPRAKGALHSALTQLAEQDPLINLRVEHASAGAGQIALSLYGEVQKEVIQATLATDFGIEVSFRETTTICVERVAVSGAAAEHLGAPDNPFRAGVGLRIDPAPEGSGVLFRLGIERGSLTAAFIKAVEETVYQTLNQGLKGWQVIDCAVTLTYSAYTPPPPYGWSIWSSSAGDFRSLTPLVVMAALKQAGTKVFEPIHRFTLEVPADTSAAVSHALSRLDAVPLATSSRVDSALLEGEIPAARVHRLQQELPALTRGEGVLESEFSRFIQVRGEIPVRPRWDHNPLHRKEYLLHVVRRV